MLYPISHSDLQRLRTVPQASLVWEAVKVPASSIMDDLPQEIADSDVVIWGDLSSEAIRNMQFVNFDDRQALIQSLATAILGVNQQVTPARPKKILVRDRRLLLFCQSLLRDLGIECEYARGESAFNQVIRDLGAELLRFDPIDSSFYQPINDLTRRLWLMSPWLYLKENEIIHLHFPKLQQQRSIYAVTVGGGIGVHLGVLFFRDRDKVLKLFTPSSNTSIEEQAIHFENCYSVTFDLDPKDALNQQNHGDENSIPKLSVAVVDNEMELRPVQDLGEARLIHACLLAYLRFVEEFSDELISCKALPESFRLNFDDPSLQFAKLDEVVVCIDQNLDKHYPASPELSQSLHSQQSTLDSYDEDDLGSILPNLDDFDLEGEDDDSTSRTIDLRAGKYSLSFEETPRDFFERLPASIAYYTPPLLSALPKIPRVLRLHLPKRRAQNMVNVLSELDLDNFLSLCLQRDEASGQFMLVFSDSADSVVLGTLQEAGMCLTEFLTQVRPRSGNMHFSALCITAGSMRPGSYPVHPNNLVGSFLFCNEWPALECL